MHPVPSVFFSNRVEILYESLRDVLFDPSRSNLFTRRLIVVPSPAMKTWLMLRMAQDPQLGFAAGIQVTYLNEALEILRSDLRMNPTEGRIPNLLEISFALENLINSKLDSTDPAWSPLQHYFKQCSKRKREKRLAALAEQLAQLFSRYGTYGGALLSQWIKAPGPEWQVRLWQELYTNFSSWSYPHKVFTDLRSSTEPQDFQVHLFALSFIPRLHFRFLSSLAKQAAVCFWIMSPCQVFWSDLCSDKEKRRLRDFWEQKQVSQSQIEALDSYLRGCNPLLANFGKLGREMAIHIEESEALTGAWFDLPDSVYAHSHYEEACLDEMRLSPSQVPLTMLQAVQADLAVLRNPEPHNPLYFPATECSIQVHSASSRLREIEVLHDNLLRLIDRHAKESHPISPSQIIVMAPDILEYEPYIKMVFGNASNFLDYQLMDLPMQSQNTLAQIFLQLIALPLGRWEASSIFTLFEQPGFYLRQGLTREDVEQIRFWTKSAGVRWGENTEHRQELLLRDHGIAGESGYLIGTWEHGWERLLSSLAMEQGVSGENVDFVKSELLGRFIALMRSLRSDLKTLEGTDKMTLAQWGDYLQCLAEAYLAPHSHEEEFSSLLQQFQQIKDASRSLSTVTFTFNSVYVRLMRAMSQKDFSYRENHLHAVKFCSMLPMRAIPSQVVAILGMHEGAYPRRDVPFSLNLLQGETLADYCPSQTDYDRYLFLEALLSARDYFLLSYCDYSPSDPKPLPPALMVTELLNYLDQGYRIAASLPSQTSVHKHPFHAYDGRYFDENSNLKSYSEEAYRIACAFYTPEKLPKTTFIENFSSVFTTAVLPGKVLRLDQLEKMLSHPLRHYCNQKMGLYLDKMDKREVDDADAFDMKKWDESILILEALKHPLEKVYQSAEKGLLPVEPFKNLAWESIKSGVEEIKGKLDGSPVFTVEFDPRCSKKYQAESGDWIFPPLIVPMGKGETVRLIGKVPYVSSFGLLQHGSRDFHNLVKLLPGYLSLQTTGMADNLFITELKKPKKAFETDPLEHLCHLIAYYYECQQTPSPLVKKMIRPILQKKSDKLEEVMKESLAGGFNDYPDDYLNWAFRSRRFPNAEQIIAEWSSKAQLLFGPIEEKWTK